MPKQKLTVKFPDGTTRVTKEGLKYLLRLYEIAYGLNLKKEYEKAKISTKEREDNIILIDYKNKCHLCDEQNTLDRAHIIPASITRHCDIDGEKPEYLKHAISLCPTHHRKYDRYTLSENDKSVMRDFISDNKYDLAFTETLQNMVVLKTTDKVDKQLLNTSWMWWREYIYGN